VSGPRKYRTKSIAEAVAAAGDSPYTPVTFGSFGHVEPPFFHGTKTLFAIGDFLTSGHQSNYHPGRVSNNVYFAALLEPAIWAAELAEAFDAPLGTARIYVVEPTGPFEDDPNVTNKRFPGNVTQSYRTPHPLRIVEEVDGWERHCAEEVQAMLDNLTRLRKQGLDLIDD
jgi:hypothetical protein